MAVRLVTHLGVVAEVIVSYRQFSDETVEYLDVPRLGGVASYLYKMHESESSTSISLCSLLCLYCNTTNSLFQNEFYGSFLMFEVVASRKSDKLHAIILALGTVFIVSSLT